MSRRGKIVVLGMMSNMPVPGVVWQTVHYLVGLERLGFEVWYVEAHGRSPSMFTGDAAGDAPQKAAQFVARVMERFGLRDRWAYHAVHDGGTTFGLDRERLQRLYRDAALVLNLHGGTVPLPEHSAGGRLVYLETDPVQLQVELAEEVQETIDFLEPHCAFFTFAENLDGPGCRLPVSRRFPFRPTRQPVVLDVWEGRGSGAGELFTTVGNWQQTWRHVTVEGELYTWSKHHEFLKLLELPARTGQAFELALANCGEADRRLLEEHGWRVRNALDWGTDIDAYRNYVAGSRAEFTVAKEQNVRLRTGWFSDRSATYLAAGRPVITQDTGFGNVLPTGEGLLAFSSLDEAVEAADAVEADYTRHSRAAAALAREYFDAPAVLGKLLEEAGVDVPARRARDGAPGSVLDPGLVLVPSSRRPLTLPPETSERILAGTTVGPVAPRARKPKPAASVVVVTYENLVFTKLCLESLLANTDTADYEVVVVDNASNDGTPGYLAELAREQEVVRVVTNRRNLGFAAASNQGLAVAAGDFLVLLNNDTVVPPGWLRRLVRHLEDPEVGMVGPVTNRSGNESEVDAPYRTYGEFTAFARQRADEYARRSVEVRSLTMFCAAMRRDVYEGIGPLDTRFEVGMLEDDDYAMRLRAARYRQVCAEDVLVHHFGEASFGKLVSTGEHGRVLAANKKRFQEKWGVPWAPYPRRPDPRYEELVERIRARVGAAVPASATVLVASRGDESLLDLAGRRAWHFPQEEGGVYAGHHPGDSAEAIAHLEALRAAGGDFLVFPKTGLWWLEHYGGLREHLERRYHAVVRDEETCVIFALRGLDANGANGAACR